LDRPLADQVFVSPAHHLSVISQIYWWFWRKVTFGRSTQWRHSYFVDQARRWKKGAFIIVLGGIYFRRLIFVHRRCDC
jgi:hypothetical protein